MIIDLGQFMKLVVGGEVEGDEAYEFFCMARARVQDKFNFVFEQVDYGLPKFHFLAIIRALDDNVSYPEVFKYFPKKKTCDYRVAINKAEFLVASDNGRCRMLSRAIGAAITDLVEKKPVDIDVHKLRCDFNRVRKDQGWD